MLQRTLFNEDHELFRDMLTRFGREEIAPHIEEWDEQRTMDRSVWNKAGELGILCPTVPEEYGGQGCDRLFSAIVLEELTPLGGLGLSFALHSDIVAPYLMRHACDATKRKYLPKMASGEAIGALGMSEPGGGSDLKALKTTAIKRGDHYILNGSKTFISNGMGCSMALVAAKTDTAAGAKGISLLVVDTDMAGFGKGKKLKKVGQRSQDTAELFFNDVKVPAENLIGEEGRGFVYMMEELPWERLQLAIGAVACAKDALNMTIAYTSERKAFGQSVIGFQNTRFKLAELKSEIQIAQVFVDKCLELTLQSDLDAATASMAKYWCSDLQCKVLDECVQLFGGYGYMSEYPIARGWTDARAQRIYGGTNEIMKELIARSL